MVTLWRAILSGKDFVGEGFCHRIFSVTNPFILCSQSLAYLACPCSVLARLLTNWTVYISLLSQILFVAYSTPFCQYIVERNFRQENAFSMECLLCTESSYYTFLLYSLSIHTQYIHASENQIRPLEALSRCGIYTIKVVKIQPQELTLIPIDCLFFDVYILIFFNITLELDCNYKIASFATSSQWVNRSFYLNVCMEMFLQ